MMVWGKLSFCDFSALWATRFTEDSKESDILIKTTLRELVVYVIFIILLCVSK